MDLLHIFTLFTVATGLRHEKYIRANLEFTVALNNETRASTLYNCFDLCQAALETTCEVVSYCKDDQYCQYGEWQDAVMDNEENPGRMFFLTDNMQAGECFPLTL